VSEHVPERDCWCCPTVIPATDEGHAGDCVVAHVDTMDGAGARQRLACIRQARAELAQ
jgi:hypothetical protein